MTVVHESVGAQAGAPEDCDARVGALRGLLRGVGFVGRQTFAAAPGSTAIVTFLSVLLAFVPGVQVLAIAGLIRSLGTGATLASVAGPLAVAVVVVGLNGPATGIQALLGERAMVRTAAVLQSRLADVVAATPASRTLEPEFAAAVESHNRVIYDAVCHVYIEGVVGAQSLLGAVGVVVTLAGFSPLAAALVVLAMVPAVVAGRRTSRAYAQMWAVLGEMYGRDGYLRQVLSRPRSLTELASLGTADRVAELIRSEQQRIAETRDIPLRAGIRAESVVGLASTILLAAALGAVVIGAGFAPAAAAGVFGGVAALAAVGQGSRHLTLHLQYAPQTTKLQAFFSSAPPPRRQVVAKYADSLVVSGLTHRYPGALVDAVDHVDITVHRGEIVALVGVNGAGKTTTVNAILGLLTPRAGTVTVDQRTREELGEDAWLGLFGLLTQEFGRYEFTVRQAVSLGSPEPVTDTQVWSALDAAHAGGFVRALARGLDTQLGQQWGGGGLSGGQWQRLALARIYLRDAPIWVLDEPTSAIDAEVEQDVFNTLQATKAERITLVVSHRAWTLRDMDRIYVFEDGRIVQQGRYEDLVSANGRFADIFREQALT